MSENQFPNGTPQDDQIPGFGTDPAQQQAPYGQTNYGQAPYGQTNYNQAPYGQTNYSQAPDGQTNYGQAPYGQTNYNQAPYGQTNYGQAPDGQTNYSQPYDVNGGYQQVNSTMNGYPLDNGVRAADGPMPNKTLYTVLLVLGFICGILWGILALGPYKKMNEAINAGNSAEANAQAKKVMIFAVIGIVLNAVILIGRFAGGY